MINGVVVVEIFKVTKNYEMYKLYNMQEVISKFGEYYGKTFEELEHYFSNYSIIEKEEVIKYLEDIYQDSPYLQNILKNRQLEHDYQEKTLKILSAKATTYLSLIDYICNGKEKDKYKEKVLEDIEIYHYSSIVTGRDINRLMVALSHLIINFNIFLDRAGTTVGFSNQRVSEFMLNCETDEIYPSEKLIIKEDDYRMDKTSLNVRKRIR